MFKLVCGPTRIGSKGDGVDREDILANLAEQEEDESSGEDDEEGIDFDIDDDGIMKVDDDGQTKEEEKEQKWILHIN